ncbi:hypothetical protein Q5P01_010349 [Channa striata]|uniref:Uncharacterized protein n=1 Tax=Channa striata TaxID=64152 RepID=A0AA88N4B8_CHASR|nr:hypothetical protein Q5P01_010349 [Channa striata]
MVSVMLDDASAAKLKTIPLSNDTFDEATDSSKDCLFISYVRFDLTDSLCEDLLFCKYVRDRARAEELFKMLDCFLFENGLTRENCIGVCSDGAQTMAGKRKGLQALIKKASANAEWTHCIIHREALASRQLSPELSEVMTDIIGVVNFIKTRPLKTRVFSAICEEMGAEHQAVLFHSEERWLSRGNFLGKLAYLSDIFGKLNELNLQLEGKDKHLPQVTDRKLVMWGRRLDEGNTDSLENLHEFVDTTDYDAISVIPHIKQHISSLMGYFKKYFPENNSQYDWVRDPFSAPAPTGFSSAEEDKFIDMTSDSTLRLRFPSQTLSEFWLSVEKQYPLLGQRAIGILLPFATSYLCETGFSVVAALKTKYRSQLNIEQELRVAVSCFKPRFEKLCTAKHAHCSH